MTHQKDRRLASSGGTDPDLGTSLTQTSSTSINMSGLTAEAKAAWDSHVDTRTGAEPPKPADPSELSTMRNAIGGSFKAAAALIGAAAAPLPDQTGDGSKIAAEEKASLYNARQDPATTILDRLLK